MEFHILRFAIEAHEKSCQEALNVGKNQCETWGLTIERRKIRRKRTPGEMTADAGLSAEQEICRIMKGVMDRLITEITTRFSRLHDLDSRF